MPDLRVPAPPTPAVAAEPLRASFVACYLANLAALYRWDAPLAARLETLPFAALPELETARDGRPTLRLSADDGQPVYVHSRYRPAEEARTFVAEFARPRSARADDAGDDSPALVVAGIGLGYHVAELERRFDKPNFIIAEDDPALLKAALCVTNLSDAIRAGRVCFLTAADKAHVHRKLRPLATFLLLGARFVTLPHAVRYHAAFHAEIRALLRDFIAFSRVQMVSLVRNNRVTFKNVAFNLPAYLAGPGIEVLARRAAGYPAILVAAGPSLARNIDQLAGLRDRAVLIAVQTVFKSLLARGIAPHFVTSLDYHEVSAQFFHGITDVDGCVLVAEPKATWHVLDAYAGRKHVLASSYVDDLLRTAAPRRGALKAGSTVAHLSFYLAEHLGCDPIILVGQDLSFSEGLYYPPGMPIERIWQPEMGRFQTIEMKQWERIIRARAQLRKVKDIHDRDVYTDDQLFTYAEQFQSDFLDSPARVIHACEGGMRLQGVEVMTLRDAAARYCTRPVPRDLFTPPPAGDSAAARAAACAALEQRLAELAELRQLAVDMRDLLAKLSDLIDRPGEFNRVVVRVDELRTRIQRHELTYRLVSAVSQLAELRRVHADRQLDVSEHETPETARRHLRRDRDFVAAFIDGCEFLESVLPPALQRVREQLA